MRSTRVSPKRPVIRTALSLGLLFFAATALAKDYVLATASPGGTYYPVGAALATLVKAELSPTHGIGMIAATTAGSVENLMLLERGEAHFGIVQGLVAHEAWTGGALLDGRAKRGFRSMSALWRNVEQFVLRTGSARNGTIEDLRSLRGRRVAFGDRNSGTLFSSRLLLANLGLDVARDFELVYMGYGAAADALRAGEVVAMSAAAGLPVKSLTRLKAAMGDAVTILGFTPQQAARADNGLGLWAPYTIPAGTYPAQPDPISTIAQPNLLVVDARVDEQHVYLVTKVMFERRDFLRAIHPATADIALENALIGLPAPLHPGARRYYEEAGLPVPARLTQ